MDTNLLLIWTVGNANPEWLKTHGRVPVSGEELFIILDEILPRLSKLITTSHVLAETSNLLKFKVHGESLKALKLTLKQITVGLEELKPDAVEVMSNPLYERLGLTDTALNAMAKDGTVLLTNDLDLYVACSEKYNNVLNLNHYL